VQGPGLEGGHELDLVDQAVLEGEQAEEQVAIGGDGGQGSGLRAGRRGGWAFVPRHGKPPSGRAGSVSIIPCRITIAAPPRSIGPFGHPVASGQRTSLSPVLRQNQRNFGASTTSAEVKLRPGTRGFRDDSGP